MWKILILLSILGVSAALVIAVALYGGFNPKQISSVPDNTPVWKYAYPVLYKAVTKPVRVVVNMPPDLSRFADITSMVVADMSGYLHFGEPVVDGRVVAPISAITIPGANGAAPTKILQGAEWKAPDGQTKTTIDIAFSKVQKIRGFSLLPAEDDTAVYTHIAVSFDKDPAEETFFAMYNHTILFKSHEARIMHVTLEYTGTPSIRSIVAYPEGKVPQSIAFTAVPELKYELRWNYENLFLTYTDLAYAERSIHPTDIISAGTGSRGVVAKSSDDADLDGIPNQFDNCPNKENTDQKDTYHLGAGDACVDTSWFNRYGGWLLYGCLIGAAASLVAAIFVRRQHLKWGLEL